MLLWRRKHIQNTKMCVFYNKIQCYLQLFKNITISSGLTLFYIIKVNKYNVIFLLYRIFLMSLLTFYAVQITKINVLFSDNVSDWDTLEQYQVFETHRFNFETMETLRRSVWAAVLSCATGRIRTGRWRPSTPLSLPSCWVGAKSCPGCEGDTSPAGTLPCMGVDQGVTSGCHWKKNKKERDRKLNS